MIDILVLDEADRMIADGHFKELSMILNHIYTQRVEIKKEMQLKRKQKGSESKILNENEAIMTEKKFLGMTDASNTKNFKVG